MNNWTEEPRLGDCMTCFSKFENYGLLQDPESQNIIDNCWNYLHENIANSKLQNFKWKNEDVLPFCKKCFDAVSELIELSELVIKSQKKISHLSFVFSLGVLYRRTQVQSVNNTPDGQISPKEFIVLEVSGISPSLFSVDQPNPDEIDDFAHPCENNFVDMDEILNKPQPIFEIVNHESEEAVDDESAESEDDTNIPKDEELPVPTETVVVLKIKKILDEADLNTITAKKVRQQLETDLKIDLADRKKEIAELVMKILEEKQDNEGKNEESSEEEEIEKKSAPKSRRGAKRGKDLDSDKGSDDEYVAYGKKTKGGKKGSDSDDDWAKKKKGGGGGAKNAPKKGGGTGYTKTCKLSSELAAVMGEEAMARHEVVRRMWVIIKEKNLYDPKNRQFAFCNKELLPVFGVKRFRTFGMMKYLKKHFVA